jgi:hypothetical protein
MKEYRLPLFQVMQGYLSESCVKHKLACQWVQHFPRLASAGNDEGFLVEPVEQTESAQSVIPPSEYELCRVLMHQSKLERVSPRILRVGSSCYQARQENHEAACTKFPVSPGELQAFASS